MQLNLKNPLVFFDLETTGVNIVKDRIIEISFVKVYPNGKEERKTRRINPEMHIPEESTAIHALITALTDNTSDAFRDMWYNYHRKGLDDMVANAERGRATILSSIPVLKQVKSARPTSPLIQLFADTKLDELVNVYSEATPQEKQEGYNDLSNLFPAFTTRLEPLKK